MCRINRLKNENHKIISINAVKVFKKNPMPSHDIKLNKVGMVGNMFNMRKAIQQKNIDYLILNGERREVFPKIKKR